MTSLIQEQVGEQDPSWTIVAATLRAMAAAQIEARKGRQVAFYEGVRSGTVAKATAVEKRRLKARGPRFLYLMQRGDLLKIGYSRNPAKRAKELRAGPEEVTVIARRKCESVDVARRIERETHERFAAFRVHGEWFSMADEILDHFNVPRMYADNSRIGTGSGHPS